MTPLEDGGHARSDAVRADDQASLAALYDRWSPLVYSLALRSLGEVASAEEVTRHVFTRAWAARRSSDSDRVRESGWLVELTWAAIVDTGTDPDTGTDIDATPNGGAPLPAPRNGKISVDAESKPAGWAELLVSDEMSHLSTVPRQVLRLALDDHLSCAQIAERTQLPLPEVQTHIASVLTTLRGRLEPTRDAH